MLKRVTFRRAFLGGLLGLMGYTGWKLRKYMPKMKDVQEIEIPAHVFFYEKWDAKNKEMEARSVEIHKFLEVKLGTQYADGSVSDCILVCA